MGLSSKRQRSKKRPAEIDTFYLVDYYQAPFFEMSRELLERSDLTLPHLIRSIYWNSVRSGFYPTSTARNLVLRYAQTVEQNLAATIRKHSLAYWLHAYRRILPDAAGENKSPITTGIVRQTFEAAIQKYAQFGLCDGIALSNEVETTKILNGRLFDSRHEKLNKAVRQNLQERPQLILTKFDIQELREVYQCEKLAYELWRCGATLRILGKGASLIVDHTTEPIFYDTRNDIIDALVRNYDNRSHPMLASATGMSFVTAIDVDSRSVLLPRYNLELENLDSLRNAFSKLEVSFRAGTVTNFLWIPYDLESFYKAHRVFGEAFREKHGVSLDSVLSVVAAFARRAIGSWTLDPGLLINSWQRAYAGPSSRESIVETLRSFIPGAAKSLGCDAPPTDVEVDSAMSFLSLRDDNRADINLLTRGPLRMILPVGKDRCFVDLAWCAQTLYNLFFDLSIGDRGEKGDALEDLVRRGNSAITTNRLKKPGKDGKQIDAAFQLGEVLVIVECRAFARSFGIDLGDATAISYRSERIKKALSDVDEKAAWLAEYPVGLNYDVSEFKYILPLAVTPFTEYIPSLDPYYWLSNSVPRVLSPTELHELLDNGQLKSLAVSSGHLHQVKEAGGQSTSSAPEARK